MTIKDIAQLSGYGVGTVSRVINNHPDVSEKAREKILSVIKETGFQPNTNARHLKMQASSSLNIIVKGTQNLLFADIVEKMQSLFSKNGENVSVYYIDEDANEVNYALGICRERNPKGIIFLGGNLEYFQEDFHLIDVPCILVTNTAEGFQFENLSSVTTPDEEAAQQVIEYLISKGHQKIGVLGGNLSSTEISYCRMSGAKKGFEKCGVEFDQDKQFEPCRFSPEAGFQGAKKLLKKNPDMTAIFAFGDLIALGAMRAIADMGKRCPEDVSVVGFDGIVLAKYNVPRLATIEQNTSLLAKSGVDLMLQRINYPYKAVHKTTPFTLIEAESVCELK